MEEKKKCTRCDEEKPLSEFYWKNKTKGIRQYRCKDCAKGDGSSWYEKNKKTHIEKVFKNNVKYRATTREYLKSYLEKHPCVDCGESDIMVLEFDHVRGEKKFNISSVIFREASLDRLDEEIKKCDIRCANCHRRKTMKQLGWFRSK